MDLPVNFKFDVRIRPRLLARGQLSEGDVTKYLEGLPDLQPQADAIDLAQPALTSPEERERVAASRPSAVVARPVPSAPPAERSAPVSIAPSAEPVDEGWDEDDDEDDVDNDDDEKDTDEEKDAETQASPQASEEVPKAAGGEEEE